MLEASFNSQTVNIDTIINNELHQHTLSFDGISNDAEIDILDKLGLQAYMPDVPAVIGQILPNSAAEKAGLKENDQILSINNVKLTHWDELVTQVKASPNKTLQLEVKRQQQVLKIAVTPEQIKENNLSTGKIGAGAKVNQAAMDKLLIQQHYSIATSFKKAVAKTWETSALSLKLMWYMVSGKISWKGISGPVTIAKYAGESASFGLKTFIGFIAFISISIGVLNLLPIPVLDGGHFMYYIAEILKGSPVSEQVMLAGQKIGFGLLGLLMTLAIFNDINRLFASS